MPNRFGLIRLRFFNSSRWWATVYLLFIPLFAAIYFSLPAHSFYHQTSQFEHGVAQDQDKAEGAIAKSMLAEVGKHELPEGWTVTAIHVRNLAPVPSGNDFSFSARFNLQRRYGAVDRKKGATMSVATASVDVIAQNETLFVTSMSTADGRQAYVVTTPAAFAPDGIVPANLFPFDYDARTKILRMPITRDAQVEIGLYLDGMHGFPHEFSWSISGECCTSARSP